MALKVNSPQIFMTNGPKQVFRRVVGLDAFADHLHEHFLDDIFRLAKGSTPLAGIKHERGPVLLEPVSP